MKQQAQKVSEELAGEAVEGFQAQAHCTMDTGGMQLMGAEYMAKEPLDDKGSMWSQWQGQQDVICGRCRYKYQVGQGHLDTSGDGMWYCGGCWREWKEQVAQKWQTEEEMPEQKEQSEGTETGYVAESVFAGFYAVHGSAPAVEPKSYTRMIPHPQGMGRLSDIYVQGLIKSKLVDPGLVLWEAYLYNSNKQPQGLQYKTPARDATVNIYLPKGTLQILGKQESSARDELLAHVLDWTLPFRK